MALFGRKDGKSLFGRRKDAEPKKPERHELVDIPLDSMIEPVSYTHLTLPTNREV